MYKHIHIYIHVSCKCMYVCKCALLYYYNVGDMSLSFLTLSMKYYYQNYILLN